MKYYAAIFISLFLAISTLGCGKDETPHTKAGILYQSGNPGNEIKDIQNPQNPDLQQIKNKLKSMSNDTLFQYALDSHNQGKYAEALAAYQRILETNKNYPDLYYCKGLLYRDMGMREEAILAFQTAIAQNPNSAEAHYNLGYAYRCKGLHNDAIAEYQKSLDLVTENKTKQRANIHYNLGFSYFSNGQIDNAINAFEKAIKYKPKDKEIHQKLGIAYTAKGWVEKAKDEFSFYNEHDNSGKKSHN